MDSKKSYWQKQLYMLSSLGLFFIILIALFAIPLVGTFVVILIKGALDLRYFIIAGGFIGLAVLGVFIIKALKRMWHHLKRDGRETAEMMRRHQLAGQPMEISFLGGLLKFSTGQPQSSGIRFQPHHRPSLPLQGTDRDGAADVIDQLQTLSELKRAGTIDTDEFDLLKAVLIEASAPSATPRNKDDRRLNKSV